MIAIRDHWLNKVYEEVIFILKIQAYHLTNQKAAFAIDDFWIKGSIYRIPQFSEYHLNGNGLYKLHDPLFKKILLEVIEKNPSEPYDVQILVRHLCIQFDNIKDIFTKYRQTHPKLYKAIHHRIVYRQFFNLIKELISLAIFFKIGQAEVKHFQSKKY